MIKMGVVLIIALLLVSKLAEHFTSLVQMDVLQINYILTDGYKKNDFYMTRARALAKKRFLFGFS